MLTTAVNIRLNISQNSFSFMKNCIIYLDLVKQEIENKDAPREEVEGLLKLDRAAMLRIWGQSDRLGSNMV